MTLACSRHGYEEPVWGQDRQHFLRAHEHAFTFFGVPRVIRIDYVARNIIDATHQASGENTHDDNPRATPHSR